MGGMCDTMLSAPTYEEMIKVGMEHVKVAHPEMAASIESMAKDDPMMLAWEKNFKQTWDNTPESAH